MSDPKATDTLVKNNVTVNIGETPYRISTFRFAKTLMVFQLLAELAAAAGVADAMKAAGEADEGGEFENPVSPGFITTLVTILPQALRNGQPALMKLLGLIVTANKQLREWEKDDEVDVQDTLLELGKDIAAEATLEEVMELVSAAVQVIGVETIVKYAGPLLGLLKR